MEPITDASASVPAEDNVITFAPSAPGFGGFGQSGVDVQAELANDAGGSG